MYVLSSFRGIQSSCLRLLAFRPTIVDHLRLLARVRGYLLVLLHRRDQEYDA